METTSVPSLVIADEFLAIPLSTPDEFGRSSSVLIVSYPEGDYDFIRADEPNTDNLKRALYAAREVGELPPGCKAVYLPNGRLFSF